jgi:formylmethanofuran dehydrogenase subunit D
LKAEFDLITGRTRRQADGLHRGKDSEEYHQATAFVEMSAEDAARLGLEEGETVHLETTAGEVQVPLTIGDLPSGLLFMPMGPTANTLVGADTDASGTPPFKDLKVQVTST